MLEARASIERVELKKGAKTAAIYAGGVRVATIAAAMIHRVELKVGLAWTPELEARVMRANEVSKAIARMVRLHAASPKSSAQLRERLAGDGVAGDIIDEALGFLRELGLVNDEALREILAEQRRERGDSRAATNAHFVKRGLTPPELDASTDEEGSTEVARRAAAKLPAGLDAPARWRRVLGALARHGYDETAAMEAARRVLGAPPVEPAD